MKKEEFPTFLNEQPTIIFGRTGRELMIMACGLAASYTLWQDLHKHPVGLALQVLSVVISGLAFAASMVIALIQVANRPLEEWFFIWMLYVLAPKLYLYMPPQEDEEDEQKLEEEAQEQRLQINARREETEED